MEIIGRSEAKSRGLKTYFTGKPCANGHTSYRYVQSGTCSECINGNRAAPNPTTEARREARTQLVQVQIRIYDDDRDDVAAGVWALAVMRNPILMQSDVDPHLLPKQKAAGTAIYAFNCYAEDVPAVRQLGADSINRRTSNPDAVRKVTFGAAANVQTAPAPDWARQPRPGDPDYK